MKLKVTVSLITILIFLILVTILNMNKNSRKILNFATSSMPYSSDPLDYDQYIHHYAFTSVLGTLVSSSKKGEITSQLAKSWSHEDNAKKWTFTLRENLKFSNGDLITAKDFELNFKRVAFLKKKSNSQSGLFENLINFENITNIEDVQGISSQKNQLILIFKVPMPDLLTKISFGFYSLAHPSLYNHTTGEWLNRKNVISSGSYEVKAWTSKSYELLLRKNISFIDYSSSIEEIHFVDLSDIHQASDLESVDMVVADKNTLMVDSTFEYIGSSEGFKIGYAECYGWNDQKSPMSNINNRKWLRYKFYEGLAKSNMEIINSFFPLVFPGIKKFNLNVKADLPAENSFNIVTHTMTKASKIKENESKLSIQEMIDLGLKNIGKDSNIKVTQLEYNDSVDIEKQFNLAINGTGIEADELIDTVRFMFLSKQGINLPDESGKILEELKKDNPDIDFINKEIWNQSIIWPIRHYTKGYWFKKQSLINYENLNLDLPAVDFQFIKWN